MSLVVPAPYLSYASPFTNHHTKDTFHDTFSDSDSTVVARTEGHVSSPSPSPSPSSSSSSSRTRLLDLRRRLKQMLRIPNKRQNVVKPAMRTTTTSTTTTTTTMEPHTHPTTVAVAAVSSTVRGHDIVPCKGILKKQPFGSPGVAPSQQQRKVWYSDSVIVHDTFGPCEYDRSMDTLAASFCLTPEMIHNIKDDLNLFKFNEMQVHPASRIYTHFFI